MSQKVTNFYMTLTVAKSDSLLRMLCHNLYTLLKMPYTLISKKKMHLFPELAAVHDM